MPYIYKVCSCGVQFMTQLSKNQDMCCNCRKNKQKNSKQPNHQKKPVTAPKITLEEMVCKIHDYNDATKENLTYGQYRTRFGE